MDSKIHILEGQDRGLSFELKHGSTYTIGRSPENDIQIRDKNISRYHLRIQRKEGKCFITDLKSKNGTFINGKDIEPGIELELNLGTPIVIGMTMLGLGDVCATCLAPFLESIGICGEISERGEALNPHRTMALKKDLELIYNVSNVSVESKNIHEILEKTLDHIFNLMKRTDRCAIILTDKKTGEISDVIYRSRKSVDNTASVYNRELVERALLLNKAVYVSDSYAEDLDEDD
ncbi:MAG: FHA domain-containing protein, partial [Deltaproteobacteria bacterium]|nr:FHA domain-containing protein [Deltaproteobacteria bacterium]